MTRLATPVLFVIGIGLAYLVIAWFGQRPMLFPVSWLPAPSSPEQIEVVHLEGAAGRHRALFLPPAPGTPTPFPVLIFAHGNGELADFWIDQFGPVQEWGWGVLLYEYPGYGRTPGRPSEATIRQSALEIYDWAAKDPRVDSTRIVAYGRSLGGGVASYLAATRPIAGLILESAFTSIRPLAAKYLLPGWIVRDPFDNLTALQGYRGPVLVIHGRHDDLVPFEHGKLLAAAVAGAEFHDLPCGHNDCPRPWDIIHSFLATHRLLGAGLPAPSLRDSSAPGSDRRQ
jgi:fermentation-respiration switch protein FrsA (DUF1100 family)